MIQAFIFDMDGTVIDSTHLDYEAWQKAMRDHDAELPYEDYIAKLGAKSSEIAKEYLDVRRRRDRQAGEPPRRVLQATRGRKGSLLLPGVEQFLQQLRNAHLKTALATGANAEKLEFIFGKLPLKQYFDAFVTADDVSQGKPDPEVFVQAAGKLGVEPADCVVMEDATTASWRPRTAACVALPSPLPAAPTSCRAPIWSWAATRKLTCCTGWRRNSRRAEVLPKAAAPPVA
jgi:beta-phosphoglucomutase-like phosphatase (HAD superfamily)